MPSVLIKIYYFEMFHVFPALSLRFDHFLCVNAPVYTLQPTVMQKKIMLCKMSSYLLLALCRQFLIIVTESFDTQFLINHKRKKLKRTDFTYIIYSMALQDISYLCFIEQHFRQGLNSEVVTSQLDLLFSSCPYTKVNESQMAASIYCMMLSD